MSEQAKAPVTGTPEETVTDDAANAALSAPDSEDGRSAEVAPEVEVEEGQQSERTDWKALALTYKGKVEALNELRKENESLRQQASAAHPPTNYQQQAQQQNHLNLLAQSIQEAQYEAAVNGDSPEGRRAALLVATLQQTYQTQAMLYQQQQLQDIPQDDRSATMAKFQTGRYGDMNAAYDAVIADRYRASTQELAKKQAELQQAQARQNRAVVGNGRPIPVTAREMGNANQSFDSPSAYQAEHARIFNELGPDAARAFAQRQMRGEVKVKGL